MAPLPDIRFEAAEIGTDPVPIMLTKGMGLAGAGGSAVVAIQLGYCVADVVSKCGVGFLIYNITMAKSAQDPGLLA